MGIVCVLKHVTPVKPRSQRANQTNVKGIVTPNASRSVALRRNQICLISGNVDARGLYSLALFSGYRLFFIFLHFFILS